MFDLKAAHCVHSIFSSLALVQDDKREPKHCDIKRTERSGIQSLVGELRCERSEGLNSLGTRLMALRGLSTRTVLTAEKLTFCRLREYSSILQQTERRRENLCRCSSNKPHILITQTAEPAQSSGNKTPENIRAILCSQLYMACNTRSLTLSGRVVINPPMSQISFTFLLSEMTAIHVFFWQTICFQSNPHWTATNRP